MTEEKENQGQRHYKFIVANLAQYSLVPCDELYHVTTYDAALSVVLNGGIVGSEADSQIYDGDLQNKTGIFLLGTQYKGEPFSKTDYPRQGADGWWPRLRFSTDSLLRNKQLFVMYTTGKGQERVAVVPPGNAEFQAHTNAYKLKPGNNKLLCCTDGKWKIVPFGGYNEPKHMINLFYLSEFLDILSLEKTKWDLVWKGDTKKKVPETTEQLTFVELLNSSMSTLRQLRTGIRTREVNSRQARQNNQQTSLHPSTFARLHKLITVLQRVTQLEPAGAGPSTQYPSSSKAQGPYSDEIDEFSTKFESLGVGSDDAEEGKEKEKEEEKGKKEEKAKRKEKEKEKDEGKEGKEKGNE